VCGGYDDAYDDFEESSDDEMHGSRSRRG
jgi:hypothetical protein